MRAINTCVGVNVVKNHYVADVENMPMASTRTPDAKLEACAILAC